MIHKFAAAAVDDVDDAAHSPPPTCSLLPRLTLFRPTTLHLSHADRELRTRNSRPIVAGKARHTGLLRLRGVARWLVLVAMALAPAGEAPVGRAAVVVSKAALLLGGRVGVLA